MDKDKDNVNVTIKAPFGICEILGVVFIILKLLGKIDWSWWWVTAPLWIPCGIVILLITIMVTCYAIEDWQNERKGRKKNG